MVWCVYFSRESSLWFGYHVFDDVFHHVFVLLFFQLNLENRHEKLPLDFHVKFLSFLTDTRNFPNSSSFLSSWRWCCNESKTKRRKLQGICNPKRRSRRRFNIYFHFYFAVSSITSVSTKKLKNTRKSLVSSCCLQFLTSFSSKTQGSNLAFTFNLNSEKLLIENWKYMCDFYLFLFCNLSCITSIWRTRSPPVSSKSVKALIN